MQMRITEDLLTKTRIRRHMKTSMAEVPFIQRNKEDPSKMSLQKFPNLPSQNLKLPLCNREKIIPQRVENLLNLSVMLRRFLMMLNYIVEIQLTLSMIRIDLSHTIRQRRTTIRICLKMQLHLYV